MKDGGLINKWRINKLNSSPKIPPTPIQGIQGLWDIPGISLSDFSSWVYWLLGEIDWNTDHSGVKQ